MYAITVAMKQKFLILLLIPIIIANPIYFIAKSVLKINSFLCKEGEKMKAKIRLDTMHDAAKFVNITSQLDGKIIVTDSEGLKVNAKSLMGMLYALEFDELWCESERDIYSHIIDYIIID